MFAAVLDDLRERGVPAVEGYPLTAPGTRPSAMWTGPESLFVDARLRPDRAAAGPFAVYRSELSA